MSLLIDINRVESVLLADGWHDVVDGSFDLDAYEFGTWEQNREYTSGKEFRAVHGGGQSGVCATGFSFKTNHEATLISGPLTAILAVKYTWTEED